MSGKPVTSCAAAAIVPPWPRTTRGAINQPCVSDIRLQATRKPVRCDSRCGRWQISQFFMDLDARGRPRPPGFQAANIRPAPSWLAGRRIVDADVRELWRGEEA